MTDPLARLATVIAALDAANRRVETLTAANAALEREIGLLKWRAANPVVTRVDHQRRLGDIATMVAEARGVKLSDLIGRDRHQPISEARNEFYDRAFEAGFSLPRIGRFCGGRHHTTVLAGRDRHRAKERAGSGDALDRPEVAARGPHEPV